MRYNCVAYTMNLYSLYQPSGTVLWMEYTRCFRDVKVGVLFFQQISILASYVGKKLDILDRRAYAYIVEHYMEPDLDRNRIATALGCSTRNLSRAFKNMTIPATIRMFRLQKSRELLHKRPDLTIKQIAEKLHFCNAKHFATCYRNFFKYSPSEERKMIRRRK